MSNSSPAQSSCGATTTPSPVRRSPVTRKSSVTATTARGTSSVDAYDIELDIAAAIDLALEQARVRFTEHGWDETLVELAAERAWLVANSAAF
jgi:hypothetical protein